MAETEKKRAGRLRVDADPITVWVAPRQFAALDAWVSDLGDPAPSHPQAIRSALAGHFRAKGYLQVAGEQI